MKQQAGFSLLELVIALAVSSLIASGLFLTFYQIHKLQDATENRMILDRTRILIKNTLEKDLTAFFIPQTYVDEQADKTAGSKEKENRKHRTVFSAQVKEKQLLELSCITTNNIQIATPDRPLAPYAVRVWYFLELTDKQRGWYTLRRVQTDDLFATKQELNKKGLVGDIIAEHIEQCSIQCWYIKHEEKNEEVMQTRSWQSKDKFLPPAPTWINIECTIASPDNRHTTTMKFSCHLFGAQAYQEMNQKNKAKKQNSQSTPKKELPKKESQSIVQNKESTPTGTTDKPTGAKDTNKP